MIASSWDDSLMLIGTTIIPYCGWTRPWPVCWRSHTIRRKALRVPIYSNTSHSPPTNRVSTQNTWPAVFVAIYHFSHSSSFHLLPVAVSLTLALSSCCHLPMTVYCSSLSLYALFPLSCPVSFAWHFEGLVFVVTAHLAAGNCTLWLPFLCQVRLSCTLGSLSSD